VIRGAEWSSIRHPYFHCPSRNCKYVRQCNDSNTTRADILDKIVWNWVKDFLTKPELLTEALEMYQSERDNESAPLRSRLQVIENLLEDNRTQLDRLIDLYISGEFQKDVLSDRKARLETNIQALENERLSIEGQINREAMTPDQISDLYDFAKKIAKGIEIADKDLLVKRQIIDSIGLTVTLAREDGHMVAYIKSVLGDQDMPITTLGS